MGDKLDCPFDLILAATILFVKKCKKWEKRITSAKGFLRLGLHHILIQLREMLLDAVKSHIKSTMHKKAVNL